MCVERMVVFYLRWRGYVGSMSIILQCTNSAELGSWPPGGRRGRRKVHREVVPQLPYSFPVLVHPEVPAVSFDPFVIYAGHIQITHRTTPRTETASISVPKSSPDRWAIHNKPPLLTGNSEQDDEPPISTDRRTQKHRGTGSSWCEKISPNVSNYAMSVSVHPLRCPRCCPRGQNGSHHSMQYSMNRTPSQSRIPTSPVSVKHTGTM